MQLGKEKEIFKMDYSICREFEEQEIFDYVSELFWKAFQKAPFEVLCAVLRVSGMQDAEWDPFEESKQSFEDYNVYLKSEAPSLTERSRWRIGLLMYCHAVEMTAPQEFLANLLRVLAGEKYHLRPFGRLGRSKKKEPFSWIPPSAKTKITELKRMAEKIGGKKLIEILDAIFDENVRNAFSHSDYIIAAEHFRWTESGIFQQVRLEYLNKVIRNCFIFFSVLLWLHTQVQKDLAKLPKYHKWPNYEVLEILSNENGIYGFSVHFSNGSKATYLRTAKGVDCVNIIIQGDGTINFMVGLIDALENAWKVDGVPFEEVNLISGETRRS